MLQFFLGTGPVTSFTALPLRMQVQLVPLTIVAGAALPINPMQEQVNLVNSQPTAGAALPVNPLRTQVNLVNTQPVAGAALPVNPLRTQVNLIGPQPVVGGTVAQFPLETIIQLVGPTVTAGAALPINPLVEIVNLVAALPNASGVVTTIPLYSQWQLLAPTPVPAATLTLISLRQLLTSGNHQPIAGTELALLPLRIEDWLVGPGITGGGVISGSVALQSFQIQFQLGVCDIITTALDLIVRLVGTANDILLRLNYNDNNFTPATGLQVVVQLRHLDRLLKPTQVSLSEIAPGKYYASGYSFLDIAYHKEQFSFVMQAVTPDGRRYEKTLPF